MSAKPSSVSASEYSEGSIRVLKGLEPVKQRPGMYTRTDNPLHVIQEVLDNAADEALAGYGKKIKVTLHADGSVSIEDDGRGIPFGLHPEEKAPVIELVFTRLHAGGKFDKGKGGAYSFSGGLHGVGVSVTNALATRLEATSYREGQSARLVFSAGDVIEPLVARPLEAGERKQGTTVRVWPDAKYFESSALPLGDLTHLLRSKAVLMPGVSVSLINEKTRDTQTWQYKGGLRDYLQQTLNGDPVIPLFEGEGFADSSNDSFAEGEGASWCVAFTEDGQPVRESYVNLIPTSAGGTPSPCAATGAMAGSVSSAIDTMAWMAVVTARLHQALGGFGAAGSLMASCGGTGLDGDDSRAVRERCIAGKPAPTTRRRPQGRARGAAGDSAAMSSVPHEVRRLEEALVQALAQRVVDAGFAHRLVHAQHPFVALADADGERQVAHAQARVAEAFDVVIGPAEPAAQEPEQLLPRVIQRAAVGGAHGGVLRLQVHQVVEALDQRTHRRLAADPVERRGGVGFLSQIGLQRLWDGR